MSAESITVLRAAQSSLSKLWKADGNIESDADESKFRIEPAEVSSVDDVRALLQRLETKSQHCIIRGEYVGDDTVAALPSDERLSNPKNVRRRKTFFRDRRSRVVCFDVDEFEPISADPVTEPQDAIREAISTLLPLEFHEASFAWQLSSSAGRPDKPGLKAHVWFWLRDARSSAALRSWANSLSLGVDKALFDPVQIHYTANPRFESGVNDPVPTRSGLYRGAVDGVDSSSIPDDAPGEYRADAGTREREPLTDAQRAELREALFQDTVRAATADEKFWSTHLGLPIAIRHDEVELFREFSKTAPNYSDAGFDAFLDRHANTAVTSDWRDAIRNCGRACSDDFEFYGDAPQSSPAPTFSVPHAEHDCSDQRNARRLERASNGLLRSLAGVFLTYDGKRWKPDVSDSAKLAATLTKVVGEEITALRAERTTQVARLSTVDTVDRQSDAALYAALAERTRPEISKARHLLEKSPAGSALLALDARIKALIGWQRQCEMRATQLAALGLLKDIVRLDADQMDKHPHLLNVANGTVDLRTGELRSHHPADLISQVCPTVYDPAARAPRFAEFMLEIMDGEADMVSFLQRSMGYSLTGETREQVFWIHAGEGSNGKGELFKTLEAVVGLSAQGGYVHTVAPVLLVADKAFDRHPAEVADLRGRRLCKASETEHGAHLREALVKSITGEDTLSGRFMGQDFFTFHSQAKLHLLTNNEPTVRGQENATWRRLLLVNYPVEFRTEAQLAAGLKGPPVDQGLRCKLLAEREGILAWLVHGAVDWYRDGLRVPAKVTRDSRRYQGEQDRVAEFVRTQCEVDFKSWVPLADVYQEYRQWCAESGYNPLGKSKLAKELRRAVPGVDPQETKRKVGDTWRWVTGSYGLRLTSVRTFEGLGGGSG